MKKINKKKAENSFIESDEVSGLSNLAKIK